MTVNFLKQLDIFFTFLRLGFTSFGGPVAHLGYFYDEFVKKKKWINEDSFAELVALCQFLPGPASSQVGMAIGLNRAGFLGGVLAWIGFTTPSAIILVLFALGIAHYNLGANQSWLHGLQIVAVSVVAQAILNMWKKLCPDKIRGIIALTTSAIILYFNSAYIQIIVLIMAAIFGAYYLKAQIVSTDLPINYGLKKRTGALFLSIFLFLLIALPLLRSFYPVQILQSFDSFYRSGALVFGGGHVVLPLLESEVVPSGWVSKDIFMAGYGLAQAVPGPLFTFAAYLGAVSKTTPNGWTGALVSLVAIFLPSFLLIVGGLPFWEKMRSLPRVRESLMGVNAAVVGILIAAFYQPVWTSAIFSLKDFLLALIGFLLLEYWRISPWIVVLLSVISSVLFY